MKKKKYILIGLLLITLIITGGLFLNSNKNESISTILNRKEYSYLPEEAKEYIGMVYEETGEIIKTEKNKKTNEPYLNPKYVDYLTLSDEEKEEVEVIPDMYVRDYTVSNTQANTALPASYDLRNVNDKNFLSPIKDQETTEICWAFTTIENAETLLLKNSNQSYTDEFQKFSVRQLDYVTTSNYLVESAIWDTCDSGSCHWDAWANEKNGSRGIGTGGNFYISSIVLANGLSLTDESVIPWTTENVPKWPKYIMGYDKSLYEVNSAIVLPSINEDSASADVINSYVNEVKTAMLSYGGPYVGTYSPQSTCGFDNTDGTKALKTDDCTGDSGTSSKGHAMQIIGWDDNYEYSYCDAGTKHYSVSNGTCSKGTLTQGQGAWILRNSWGEESDTGNAYKYVYLTYDSTRLAIGYITSLSEMATRTWDNNYHNNPWINGSVSNGMVSSSSQVIEFDTHNNSEKIEKIKLFTATENNEYNVTIITDNDVLNNVATLTSGQTGIYTIDLSNKNITVGGKFSVKVTGKNGAQFFNNSISVFTSNIENTPKVVTYSSKAYDSTKPLSNENPLFVSGDNYWSVQVDNYLKNLPSNANLIYRLEKDGKIATEGQIAEFKKFIAIDEGKALFNGSYSRSNDYFATSEAYGETYTFEIVYNDQIVDSFPIKFSGKGKTTTSTITYHANNGTDNVVTVKANDKTKASLKTTYLNRKEFYNNGLYIKSWNTKPDGTGQTIGLDEEITVYHDMDVYAQWSTTELKVKFNFKCNYTESCTGSMDPITAYISDSITIPENTLTNGTSTFTNWNIYKVEEANKGLILYEEETRTIESILNNMKISYSQGYFVYNNSEIDLYANWSDDPKTISFNANGGSGTMKDMNYAPFIIGNNVYNIRIKDNLFTKTGSTFTGWNTKADGTGTSYTDYGALNDNLTLYAQWEINKYTVTFKKNGGTGTMASQEVLYNTSTKLNKNLFTRDGYKYIGWNTKADGSGTSYKDEQNVKFKKNVTLYAQWQQRDINALSDGDISISENDIDFGVLNTTATSNIEKTITIKNTGTKNMTLNITVPTSNGPFAIISPDSNTLTPGETKTLKLLARTNSPYSSIPNDYNGNYVITAIEEGTSEEYVLYVKAKVKVVERNTSIEYTTHVQNIGWQKYVSNGEMAGTQGKAYRLEGIKIRLADQEYAGNIEYRTHIQYIGWEKEFKKNDEMSGTEGKAYRLEAIEIKLTGDIADHYDVYYRVHAENFGWLGWARNGEQSGTAGYAYRLEGIEIKLVKKTETLTAYGKGIIFWEKGVGGTKPNQNNNTNPDPNPPAPADKLVTYTTHVQNIGWQDYVFDGAMAGTEGKAYRLEGIKIKLVNPQYSGNIEYRTHIQYIGWESNFKKNDEMSGTEGKAYRLEAIEIKLTDQMAEHYDVFYRVHAENFGWLGWAKNGAQAGTAGYAYRLEGIEIKLLPKGQTPEGYGTGNKPFYEK